MRRGEEMAEVEAFLNSEDAHRTRRRKPHHLPPEWYATTAAVYCVTLCARHHGEPFANTAVAQGTVAALRYYRDHGFCMVYAYCLMPDHLHAIMRLLTPAGPRPAAWGSEQEAPLKGLMKLVGNFKQYTTREVAWKHGLRGRLWQRDLYDHIARGEEDFQAQCLYALNNPVRRGMVERWRDYPLSGVLDEWAGCENVL